MRALNWFVKITVIVRKVIRAFLAHVYLILHVHLMLVAVVVPQVQCADQQEMLVFPQPADNAVLQPVSVHIHLERQHAVAAQQAKLVNQMVPAATLAPGGVVMRDVLAMNNAKIFCLDHIATLIQVTA